MQRTSGLNLFFLLEKKKTQSAERLLHPISDSEFGFLGAKFHCKSTKLKHLRVQASFDKNMDTKALT